jgi:hypothetical protein
LARRPRLSLVESELPTVLDFLWTFERPVGNRAQEMLDSVGRCL